MNEQKNPWKYRQNLQVVTPGEDSRSNHRHGHGHGHSHGGHRQVPNNEKKKKSFFG